MLITKVFEKLKPDDLLWKLSGELSGNGFVQFLMPPGYQQRLRELEDLILDLFGCLFASPSRRPRVVSALRVLAIYKGYGNLFARSDGYNFCAQAPHRSEIQNGRSPSCLSPSAKAFCFFYDIAIPCKAGPILFPQAPEAM